MTTVFYSNRMEELAEALGESLFAAGTHPFEKRLIVVPSHPMKNYLSHFFASHPRYQVCSGIQLMTLSESFLELLSFYPNKQIRIPTILELSLQIEAIVHRICDHQVEDREIFEPLFHCLDVNKEKQERRIATFSVQLATLFSRYGLYGTTFLNIWLKKRGWQQWIWNQIYLPSSTNVLNLMNWTYPIDALNSLEGELQQVGAFQLHIFGFHSFPKIYYHFFCKWGAVFYQLMPCSLFWEDLISSKERIRLRRFLEKKNIKIEDLDQWDRYVQDTNPLLANWGKVGREFVRQLESSQVISEERYRDPIGDSRLAWMQRDLLYLNSSHSPSSNCLCITDDSIQIHSSHSIYREIEILYEQLCHILKSTQIQPKEILVLAHDIDLYAPFIQMIFGSQESCLKFRIEGLSSGNEGDIFQGILHMLSIPQERFSVEAVLGLLAFPSILEKWNLSSQDVLTLTEWISRVNIRWGLNTSLSNEKLGSWEMGLDRLLMGLIMTMDEEKALEFQGDLWPDAGLDLSDIDLFEKLVLLLQSLEADLKPVSFKEKKSLLEWFDFLEMLADNYFNKSDNQAHFCSEINRLRAHLAFLNDRIFSVITLIRICQSFVGGDAKNFSTYHLQEVVFRSLAKGHITPASVIWLLGIDESSFPRNQLPLALCEMKQPDEFIPTIAEEDRYLFLETLLLAQEMWIISYQRIHSQDGKPQNPSLLVSELFQYLNLSYNEWIIHHPLFGFDPSYFKGGFYTNLKDREFGKGAPCQIPDPSSSCIPWEGHSDRLYRCAQWYTQNMQSPAVSKSMPIQDLDQNTIVLKDLFALAKHPIRFYLQQRLQIWMNVDNDTEKDFIIDNLHMHGFRKKILKAQGEGIALAPLIKAWKAQGQLPISGFGELAIHQLKKEEAEIDQSLQVFQLTPDQLITIELSPFCDQLTQVKANYWMAPALKIIVSDRERILIGTIDNITPQGILFRGKNNIQSWVECWPYLLVLGCIGPTPYHHHMRILLTQDGKMLDGGDLNYLSLMQHYLEYYLEGRQRISVLMPKWIPSLLSQSATQFEAAIQASLSDFQFNDLYLDWFKRRDALSDLQEGFEMWAPYAQQLFNPMLRVWDKKGQLHEEI